jgi:hypothetical protein
VRRAAVAVLILIALGATGAACGGGGGDASNATSTANFEQLRDSLTRQLDSVGPNIGSMPDDVLNQILNNCHELEQFVDEGSINNLCEAIRRARDTDDPGLIDQIVAQLAQLQRK